VGKDYPDTLPAGATLLQLGDGIRDGGLKPGAPETKHILGKMFLASFISGGRTPGFEFAV
jgi:hypothetical protein